MRQQLGIIGAAALTVLAPSVTTAAETVERIVAKVNGQIITLTELNAEGRLVAIISHVDELRTRIGTRLEVTAGNTGSTTRFVGG